MMAAMDDNGDNNGAIDGYYRKKMRMMVMTIDGNDDDGWK